MPRKAPKPTLAERLRAHREAFDLSLEMGITPADAAKILESRAAAARAREAQARLDRLTQSPLRPEPTADPPPQPWWNRD